MKNLIGRVRPVRPILSVNIQKYLITSVEEEIKTQTGVKVLIIKRVVSFRQIAVNSSGVESVKGMSKQDDEVVKIILFVGDILIEVESAFLYFLCKFFQRIEHFCNDSLQGFWIFFW